MLSGVKHKYLVFAVAVVTVMTCSASEATPTKLGAVIVPVARILGTRNVAPPTSPGMYVSAVAVLRLLSPPFASENARYWTEVVALFVVVTCVADDALPVSGPLNDAAVMLPVLVRTCVCGT